MACASWLHLHSPSLTRVILPVLHHPTAPSTAFLHQLNRFSSPVRLTFSVNQTNPLLTPVHAQAKRGLSFKDNKIASPEDLRFESPLEIVVYPDPILRKRNKRIDTFDENLKKLVDEMFDVMYKTDGIGLSAPQVGINVQLMVFNPVGNRGEGQEIVLINPKVTKYSKKMVLFNEGCLSFPRIYADVERLESVKIDAQDINGAKFTVDLSELPARVFQHEFDHLQGILFFDRMTDEVLDSIRGQLEALERKYEDNTGLPSPEKVETRKRKKAGVGFGKS
ncbi:peptide deformylase 1B, chloroplastic/mitochondrial-like [Hibiscus syriacus]|uniref:peptide deformylase 1B, chloroplastic/mitochondrial-like n=1 Tax=Hibiscus syriacus TaxID=106335 RepID=UPI0019237FE9|nr:peptide deformylase 1B, chloroplastic/mitochondrial-like [Hibiscus syriacus]XP_039026015.1 peptide deformylase 1B, chloroplastic/mitochondrial-like [Hibiscus syriacus]XP_039026016.1 peptide deformylase 1B, chloroplastic/mitochondrial-like [Hibiscus syriacus]